MGLQWYRRWRYFSSKRLFSISFLTEDRVKVINEDQWEHLVKQIYLKMSTSNNFPIKYKTFNGTLNILLHKLKLNQTYPLRSVHIYKSYDMSDNSADALDPST